MQPFSGVWAVDGSDVVYVDANSSYLTYTQHGNHKVRRETVGYPHARHHPWLYIDHALKSFIFTVSGVKIIIYQDRFPHLSSPKQRESDPPGRFSGRCVEPKSSPD